MLLVALERYNKMKGGAPERLVSGSDDFTMFLWEPAVSKHPKARMTGYQQVQRIRMIFCFACHPCS
jgi:ribosome assembly protein 4